MYPANWTRTDSGLVSPPPGLSLSGGGATTDTLYPVIKAVGGLSVVLEDHEVALATHRWRREDSVSRDTALREDRYIRRFLTFLGSQTCPDGMEYGVTGFDLGLPGPGNRLIADWLARIQDPDDPEDTVQQAVVHGVYADMRAAVDKFLKYLCDPSAILVYDSPKLLNLDWRPHQRGTLLVPERYGWLVRPNMLDCGPRRHKSHHQLPVPSLVPDWLLVLEFLHHELEKFRRTKNWRSFVPVRATAMVTLGSIAGPRPEELCLCKEHEITPTEFHIHHGALKTGGAWLPRDARRAGEDRYGNPYGFDRVVPFRPYIPEPEEVVCWLQDYKKLLPEVGVSLEEGRAFFPTRPSENSPEQCLSRAGYWWDFKALIRRVAETPTIKAILGPYIIRPTADPSTWRIRITPHMLRAIYATHRMSLLNGINDEREIRELMWHMGWVCRQTVDTYNRPPRLGTTEVTGAVVAWAKALGA